ncbi:hypothetical protein D918_03197 [Trichuris suis]|nr:hypothetical protein D918_03197 [Trichuris suis]
MFVHHNSITSVDRRSNFVQCKICIVLNACIQRNQADGAHTVEAVVSLSVFPADNSESIVVVVSLPTSYRWGIVFSSPLPKALLVNEVMIHDPPCRFPDSVWSIVSELWSFKFFPLSSQSNARPITRPMWPRKAVRIVVLNNNNNAKLCGKVLIVLDRCRIKSRACQREGILQRGNMVSMDRLELESSKKLYTTRFCDF